MDIDKTRYVYQGLSNIVHKEYSDKGSPYAEYYTANDQVISQKMFGLHGRITPGKEETLKTNGGLMYYQYDGTRSVTELTNRHGDVIEQYRYDVFGNILTGITAPYNTKGYTGQDYDEKSGLVHMNARWYNSEVGRFTSKDTYIGTLSNPQSQNLYTYVTNNPMKYWDPTGHQIKRYTRSELEGKSRVTLTSMIRQQSDYWFEDYDIFNETGKWTTKQEIAHANAELMRDVRSYIYERVGSPSVSYGSWYQTNENILTDKIIYTFERRKTTVTTYKNDYDTKTETVHDYYTRTEVVMAEEIAGMNEVAKAELIENLVGDAPVNEDNKVRTERSTNYGIINDSKDAILNTVSTTKIAIDVGNDSVQERFNAMYNSNSQAWDVAHAVLEAHPVAGIPLELYSQINNQGSGEIELIDIYDDLIPVGMFSAPSQRLIDKLRKLMDLLDEGMKKSQDNVEENEGMGNIENRFEYIWTGEYVTTEFKEKVVEISDRLEMNPDDLMGIMAFESYIDPTTVNSIGATGLIQFMPSTAEWLGTSTDELVEMSAIEQLDYVEDYFESFTGNLNDISDAYMTVLLPVAVGKDKEYALGIKDSDKIFFGKITYGKFYENNSGLDYNGDGKITKWEATKKVIERRNTYEKK